MTSIRISKENRVKLNELKTELSAKNINEVITHLIEVNDKYMNAKIIRLVEE